MSNDVWGTPTVAGDLVYVTSFEVHALDVQTGRRSFKTRDVAWSMAVADGRIHASDGPTLFALDAREGGDLWRLSTDAWVYSLKAERGTVVTGTRGGGVQGWEASTGQKLWQLTGAQTDFESPEAGPALHDGTVYVWQDARLRALDARTGDERWAYPIGDAASCGGVPVRITPPPTVRSTSPPAPVSCPSRWRAAGSAGTSRPRPSSSARPPSPPDPRSRAAASTSPTTSVRSTPSTPPTAATAGASRPSPGRRSNRSSSPPPRPRRQRQGALHARRGHRYTQVALPGGRRHRGHPAVAEGRIHFGSTDHLLYTLKSDDGRLRWKLATGGEITGAPVVRDGVVYACSKDRCVYALDAEKGTGTARTA